MNKSFFLKVLKLSPILIGAVLLTFNIIFWSNVQDRIPVNNISGTSITTSVVLYSASIQLRYCPIHRCFILYDSLASLWIDIKQILDPILATNINAIVVLIGIILFIWLIWFIIYKRKKPGPKKSPGFIIYMKIKTIPAINKMIART